MWEVGGGKKPKQETHQPLRAYPKTWDTDWHRRTRTNTDLVFGQALRHRGTKTHSVLGGSASWW